MPGLDRAFSSRSAGWTWLRSIVLDPLRADVVRNISETLYANALRLDRPLALGAG